MSDSPSTSRTILVIDDTSASSKLVEIGLAAQGWQVVAARSGEDGLRQAQEKAPNLILLDILMPGMDGFETCRRLKASSSTRNIPVIFMTGLTDTKSQLAGFDAGGVDYVAKPFQLAEVIARVRSHLALQHYRERLQQLVEERTAELEQTNEDLRIANRRLEAAQVQLVQSEKMASIGVLAAGVAHEINNPIGFVNSNLGCLEGYIEQLLAVIAAYRDSDMAFPSGDPVRFATGPERGQHDLSFLVQDVKDLLRESKDGLARVKKIVQDLKDFSRVGENDWQMSDVHQGLESTLNIVLNELKYKAEVVRQFGDIPEIECLPSELNQVFMNLLVNAGHAIQTEGKIFVATGVQNQDVWIEVGDTGSGIAPEILGRIFDPFFTTKPVGQGTGLGLSITYGIIQKHHGRIEVESVIGRGTTFRVWLPAKQPV